MYNSLVERCFNDCVDTFKHKSLQKQEETCVRRCAEKFLKHSMRVGMRFAELNQGAATQDWKFSQSRVETQDIVFFLIDLLSFKFLISSALFLSLHFRDFKFL